MRRKKPSAGHLQSRLVGDFDDRPDADCHADYLFPTRPPDLDAVPAGGGGFVDDGGSSPV
jgi:hypothetical protein